MRTATAVLLVLSLAVLPACQMNERLSGTLFGATGGAVIGGVTSGFAGVVIGGVLGGVAGYLIGDYMADRRERGRPSVFGSGSDTQLAGDVRVIEARDAYDRARAAETSVEARRWLEESLRLNPDRPEPYNALALNALYAGDRDQAEAYLLTALEKDPDYEMAKLNLKKLRAEQ